MDDVPEILSLAAIQKIDRLCGQFEASWTSGGKPRLEHYLWSVTDEERKPLLRSLLRVELELIARSGGRVTRGKYLRRFEDHADVVNAVFSDWKQKHKDAGRGERSAGDEDTVVDPEESSSPEDAELRDKVILSVIAGPHEGAEFVFDAHDTFLVGRSTKAHLCLAGDGHFSRYHFRLEVNPPQCYLVDLGSRNGTLVNEQVVDEALLSNGDVIGCGKTQLRVQIQPAVPNALPRTLFRPAPTPSAPLVGLPPVLMRGGNPLNLPSFPDYDVMQELGRGTLGIVYRVVQKSTSRQMAVKIIVPARDMRKRLLELFTREIGGLSKLRHRCIVRFYEMGMVSGQLFLAMEYIRAIDVQALLNESDSQARTRIACAVAYDVLSALRYAHKRSIVHRDIKPANILNSRRGRKLHTKVADFGLARNYAKAGFGDVVAHNPDRRSLAAYMSPEQVMNCRFAEPTCDLYATGVLLYFYLTGKLPFDFSSSRSGLAVVLDEPPIPIQEHLPDIPADLAFAVHHAFNKDPDRRFSSADEMRTALAPFAGRT